jgi:ribosomal protein S18 acetylase RimI-like enzyme
VSVSVRPIDELDRDWIREQLRNRLGGETIATRAETYDASALPGFVAVDDAGSRVGLITYRLLPDQCCDIGVVEALVEGAGVGTSLLDAVGQMACEQPGCTRLRAITTTDDERGLAWYRKQGFNVVEVRKSEIELQRSL